MALQLLEIAQTDQLSACQLSLLLGVFTSDNQIERFLTFARKILQVNKSILYFKDEPYFWYASAEEFQAFQAQPEANLAPYFAGQCMIDHQHPQYQNFSQHIQNLGVEHQRLLAFDLQKADRESIGQILFFDDQQTGWNEGQKELVEEYCLNLVRYLELKFDYAELKERYEQQSALNFSKTKFFQVIAHDLRAPFHGLLGFSEVLAQERDTLDELSIQSIADYLYDTAQSTYSLLESLLNWAIAEGGRFAPHPINFQLKQVSKIVYDVLNSLAIKKNIQLIDEIPDNLKVYADMNMITSVLQNLVSNALKFTHMDGTGKVIISARQVGNHVEIMIQDTGLGMTAAQLEHLFQPRIAVSFKGTAGEKGTGLGLVLCKRFLELNQGEIKVTSKEGEGTRFTVILPAAQDAHVTLINEMNQKNQTDHSAKLA